MRWQELARRERAGETHDGDAGLAPAAPSPPGVAPVLGARGSVPASIIRGDGWRLLTRRAQRRAAQWLAAP